MAVRRWKVTLEIGSYFGVSARAATVAQVTVRTGTAGNAWSAQGSAVCAPVDRRVFNYRTGARLALKRALEGVEHPAGRKEAVWLAFDSFCRAGLAPGGQGSWARFTTTVTESVPRPRVVTDDVTEGWNGLRSRYLGEVPAGAAPWGPWPGPRRW